MGGTDSRPDLPVPVSVTAVAGGDRIVSSNRAVLWPNSKHRITFTYQVKQQVAVRFLVYHNIVFTQDVHDNTNSTLSTEFTFPILVHDTLKQNCVLFEQNYDKVLYALEASVSHLAPYPYRIWTPSLKLKPGKWVIPPGFAEGFNLFGDWVKNGVRSKKQEAAAIVVAPAVDAASPVVSLLPPEAPSSVANSRAAALGDFEGVEGVLNLNWPRMEGIPEQAEQPGMVPPPGGVA